MEMPLWKTYCFWAQNALIFLTRPSGRDGGEREMRCDAMHPGPIREAVGAETGAGAGGRAGVACHG